MAPRCITKYSGYQRVSFPIPDTIIMGDVNNFEHIPPGIILCYLLLVLVPGTRCACADSDPVEVTGFNISDIPRNLRSDLKYLKISGTNIHTLNLTVAVEYPEMCRLDISTSPLDRVITPNPPHTLALYSLRLWGGYFPIIPDLGDVLERQIEYLTFSYMGIITIPDNYFENFTSLIAFSLTNNPISDLNAGNMAGLSHLKSIFLGNNQLNPLPLLHQWLPNLIRLHAPRNGISLLPVSVVEHLRNLLYLDLHDNELSTVPSRENFVNLENMARISLEGNQLHCDTQLCWIKVIPVDNMQDNHVVILQSFFYKE